jgi:hypothetical protein
MSVLRPAACRPVALRHRCRIGKARDAHYLRTSRIRDGDNDKPPGARGQFNKDIESRSLRVFVVGAEFVGASPVAACLEVIQAHAKPSMVTRNVAQTSEIGLPIAMWCPSDAVSIRSASAS